ncbi:MAG: hypothetical protein GY873_39145 [Bosea sp.]|uniref:hypothetical protein n=1 Tax=Bosea sp. (in: a-proteobacteria) TaxID=1871050 RepID=UPI0023876E23|nr:hypothetical protein [Bosea sp. (in: a-proteobacteria)]MCP4740221.1 hypothetical protein [Bosea sp. (in: a-proteobacteria)]
MRRKGELSSGAVDRGWPFQIAARQIEGQNFGHIPAIGGFSSLCWRRWRVHDGSHAFEVFCFADSAQAASFRDTIGGEDFDPRDRCGFRWERGRGAKRDARRR